jgi:glutamate-1-semialdehyde 2,1-aminomutase
METVDTSVSSSSRMAGAPPGALEAWQEEVVSLYREKTPESARLAARAEMAFPGGDTRLTVFLLPYGPFALRGQGPHLWDADGTKILDFSSPTALIHGHCHPAISTAITAQLELGTAWNARNTVQLDFADEVMSRVPSMEQVRLTNSGTEANMLMVKVARAFTGRDVVLKVDPGYHGTYDGLEFELDSQGAMSAWSGGGPASLRENVVLGRFNDLESAIHTINATPGDLAAIIVCPVVSNGPYLPARRDFLEGLRQAADSAGALLLFDEVVSFRLERGGAQAHYDVRPDMTALGKFVGGGLPIGVFGGRRDIMAITDPAGRRAITHGGTFNGNPLSAAAGIAALQLLTDTAFHAINSLGDRLRLGLSQLVAENELPFKVNGVGSMMSVDLDGSVASQLPNGGEVVSHTIRAALYASGILGFPQFAVSTVMTEDDIDQALGVAGEVLARVPKL